MKTTRWAGCGLLLFLTGLGGCGHREERTRLGEVERLPRLEVVRPELHPKLRVARVYLATVEPWEKADLCAQVRGVVGPITPTSEIGSFVKKGDVVLQLEVPDLSAERANKKATLEQMEKMKALAEQAVVVGKAEVKEAEAQVNRFLADEKFRKLQADRITQLAQGETVTRQMADEALLQFQAAQAALAASRAQVLTKEARLESAEKELVVASSRIKVAQAELEKANVQVEFASLKAPFPGVITKRWVDAGAAVKDASMPLLTIMRTDKVRVLLDIPERDVPYISSNGQGNVVELHFPVLQELIGSKQFEGTINLMASALDSTTRTMRAEVHLQNQLGSRSGLLRPQMTGTGVVVLAERRAITVPSSALVRAGNKVEIYVVADASGEPPRGVVKRLEVQLGLDDGVRVEVKNERLTGKELVIAKGVGVIRPGDEVLGILNKSPELSTPTGGKSNGGH